MQHRDQELGAAEAVLDAAMAHEGRAALVVGEAGTGKTTLLDAVRALAGERRMRVLRARGTELDRDYGYGTVQALLDPAVRAGGDGLWEGSAALARPVFEPLSRGAEEDFEDVHGADFARRQGLYWLIVALAERDGPLALLVDDVHWADEPSVRLLYHLAGRLDGLPVAIVAATRPTAGVEPDAALHELAAEGDTIALGPLSAAATSALVAEALGDTDLAAACHAATGGNPLLLRELLLDLSARDRLPAASALGTVGVRTIGDRVERELRRTSPGAVSLAQAIAVLGDDVSVKDAVDLAELDREEAREALRALEAGTLVAENEDGTLRFVHPVVRSSVHGAMSLLERRELHAWAARRLHESRRPPERVAVHLVAAGRIAEPWAVEALTAAAARAIELGQPGDAARFLRRALDDADAQDPELLAALAVAEAAAGAPEALERFAAALAVCDDAPARLRLARDHAGALSMGARTDEAFASFERVRVELDGRLSPALELGARAAGHALALWSRSPDAMALREEHLARLDADPGWLEAEAPSDPERQLAAVLAYEHAIRGRPVAAPLLARAFRGGGFGADLGASPSWGYGIWALVMSDRIADALAEIDRLAAEARAAGAAVVGALCDCLRALAHYRTGDLLAAEADAQQSLVLAAQPSWRLGRIACTAFLAETLLAQGRAADARAALDAVPPGDLAGAGDSNLVDLFTAARAQVLTAEGRPADALAELDALGARLEAHGWSSPAFIPWRSLAAAAHAALGAHDRARALTAHDMDVAGRAQAHGALARAQLAHALAAPALDATELERAAATAASAGVKLVEAGALVNLGRAMRIGGDRGAAREPLRGGLALAQRCGARGLADEALEELSASGARPRRADVEGAAALTASEARIASLAAEGATNRQIAQRLYVTQKTVEMHLRNVYRKLDVSGRAQLPAALAA